MPRTPKHINGSKTMAVNARDFDKMAKEQGYYYYCTGCTYKFLSINDSEHSCRGITQKHHRNDYFPIRDKVF